MSGTLVRAGAPDAVAERRPAAGRTTWLVAGAGALGLACIASLAIGTRGIDLGSVVAALGGSRDDIAEVAVAKRIPRTVLAVAVGASLAMSGTTMQAITRNPLADPGLLGVSSGAGLAVAIGIAFFGLSGPYEYLVLAVLGAAVTSVFVYAVGSLGRGGASPLKLALAGAATSAAVSSMISAVLLPRVDVIADFRFWQVGGVGGATWDRIGVVLPFLTVGALVCLVNARGMNSLALGDDLAAGLGTDVHRTRLASAVGAVVLCGVATSVAGPIAFVGLGVPHVGRLLIGSDHRWLLPFAAIGGAGLLVTADVVGRVVARPSEIEVGVVSAVIGAPVLIWVAGRRRLREL